MNKINPLLVKSEQEKILMGVKRVSVWYVIEARSGKHVDGPYTRAENALNALKLHTEKGKPLKVVSLALPAKFIRCWMLVDRLARDGSDMIWQEDWNTLREHAFEALFGTSVRQAHADKDAQEASHN
jgi:hypothetical protein